MKLGYAFEIAASVPDHGPSVQFYEQLGYQRLNDPLFPSDVVLTDGMMRLRLRRGDAGKTSLVYFAENLTEQTEELTRQGITVEQPNETSQIREARFKDPNHLGVSLLEVEKARLVLPPMNPISKAGRFGELSIETEDLKSSLDFWAKLEFEPTEYMPDPPETWGSVSDGLLMLGFYTKGHLPHIIKTPTITYFEQDMPQRLKQLKQEGMSFVQELPGANAEAGHAVAQAPDGQLIFLFGF